MSTENKLEAKLQACFPFRDLEFRPARTWARNGKFYAQMLTYISSRAVMQRLDDVFGTMSWSARFLPIEGGITCQIKANETVKEDAAENNPDFPVKGVRSDALKRAAVHFGIGRYLYDLGNSESEIYPQPTGLPNEIPFSGKVKTSGQEQWIDGFVAIMLPEWALLPEDLATFKAAYSKLLGAPVGQPPERKAESMIVPPQAVANVIASTVAAVSSPTDTWPYRYKPDFDTGQAIRPKIKELQAQKLAMYDKETKPWSILTKIPIPEWQSFASNVAAVTSGAGVGKTGRVKPLVPQPAQALPFDSMPDATTSVDLTEQEVDEVPW